jgi:cathepsin L
MKPFFTTFALLAVLAAVAVHAISPTNWEEFKEFHGKKFQSPMHEAKRKAHFENNKKRIEEHNKKFAMGQVSYSLALNKHADEDPREFTKVRNGARMPADYKQQLESHKKDKKHNDTMERSTRAVPATFDWRSSGKVSAVRDQGYCGSCWSFSTMGSIESQVLKANKASTLLSEQQLVDCDSYDSGCDGGWPTNAMTWLQYNGGATSNNAYPYQAQDGGCQNAAAVQKVTGYGQLKMPTTDTTLKNYLYTNGPLSIAVDASNWDPSYHSGTINCGSPNMDHAVLLVGWGSNY